MCTDLLRNWTVLVVTILISSCTTLHLGGGISYDHGRSAGCPDKSDLGVHVVSEYYFGKKEGFGLAVEAGPLGYTGCGDGDPLIHLSPLLKYKTLIGKKTFLIPYGGYAFGPFVDEGYRTGIGLRYYTGRNIYFDSAIDYYSAFKQREDVIPADRSENLGFKMRIGYSF